MTGPSNVSGKVLATSKINIFCYYFSNIVFETIVYMLPNSGSYAWPPYECSNSFTNMASKSGISTSEARACYVMENIDREL
jgi:hypothetical protein